MIDVNDRVPLYPGRVKMTPVSGQANVYDMVRADQPQKGGTPLNRNTFRQTQADIRTYPIATGNSVTAGDVVDVANVLAPVTKPLGEYTEGDVVQLNENGVPVDFYVAKHDYEAALNGSGRTLLVRKLSDNNSGNDYVWNSSSFNNLSGSTIDTTLNNTYKARFDKSVQVAMATTKFYYTIGNGDASIGTLERSIFLLSNTEIGGTQESYLNIEGETLPIASVLKTSNVDNYSRSVVTTDAQSVMYFTASGGHGSLVANKARAASPCFTLPNTFLIDTGEKIQTGEKEIIKSVVAEANVQNVFVTNAITKNTICCLNDNVSVAAYVQSNQLVASLLDNQTGKVINTQNSTSAATDVSLARLSDTKAVVSWAYGSQVYTRLVTIDTSSITFGTTVQPTGNNSEYPCVVALDTDKVVVFYSSVGADSIDANVGTISGNTITYPLSGYSKSGYAPANISATLLPDDSSGNKRVCVCFSDTNDSNKGKAVIATINSSNVVTWGSVVTFNSVNNRSISCAANGNTVVVSYNFGENLAACQALIVNGTSIAVGSQTSLLQIEFGFRNCIIYVGKNFIVCGSGITTSFTPTNSYATVLNVSGTTITVNTAYKFRSGVLSYLSACPISDNKFIIAYADSGNAYGTDTILEINGNQIAGGFTDTSAQAIALESGEAGQEIEVIFAGTTAADFVTEGQAIPSDGVYGYGPVGGWLNVIPYWAKEAGVRIATGSYVGTGTSGSTNPNMLTFKFEPKLLVISGDTGAQGIFVINSVARAEYSNTNVILNVKWEGKTVTWWARAANEAAGQLNNGDTTYYYVALG